MANIIAVIWDFDKTLVSEYMQTPIFEDNGVDGSEFWKEVDAFAENIKKTGVRVNADTCYLNFLIKYAQDGRFKDLSNAKLREYGQRLRFYNGVPEIFDNIKNVVANEPKYQEYGIKVEHYINPLFSKILRRSGSLSMSRKHTAISLNFFGKSFPTTPSGVEKIPGNGTEPSLQSPKTSSLVPRVM